MEALAVFALVLLNGVFAMSEVALLTARKSRLSQLAQDGDQLAAAALRLAADPTRFLSTIQIGITSVGILNGIIGDAVFSADLAAWLQGRFGLEAKTSGYVATGIIVLGITYVTIVAGELVPKRLGQHNAVGIARLVALPMLLLAKISAPFVWLLSRSTNAILNPLLRLAAMRRGEMSGEVTPEEIRTILLEYSNILPKKHISILGNLFDVSDVTVEDIMVPRAKIESIKLDDDLETIVHQLGTAYHLRLPVFRDALGEVVGVLQLRRVLAPLRSGDLDKAMLESLVEEPYFVPKSTPALSQIQYFQENQKRMALVVDEYGELMGLVTVEDVIEEIIGKFTTSLPGPTPLAWDEHGAATADGAMPVREVNRALGLDLPLDGPRTLNGLILEQLQDIPEADVSIKIGAVPMEIVHAQGRTVKTVRIFKPVEAVENVAPSET